MRRLFPVLLVLLVVGIPSCSLLIGSLGGSIEGSVLVDELADGFVLLLNAIDDLDQIQDLTEAGLSAITNIVKGFGLIGSDGSFEIPAVPSGKYYMVAVIDANGNNTLDNTDMVGWYGNDTTFVYEGDTVTITIPESFTMEEKEEKTDMNITRVMAKDDFERYYDYITEETGK